MINITATYYEKSDKTIIFVNGLALNANENSISNGYKLADESGQKEFILTTYPLNGMPKKENLFN
ncbi:MAG: hypothetical protein M0R03_22495 [Novosphingobium sp.]|jgi:hypothetical protein|nr:hypothetical protein [Novosphingobium sp.]